MAHHYRPRLVCIARCKNEIHIIKRWYESLPFVDLFCMTDNNSTDGTYEYLKSLDNVLVTRVEGFDEGRDFQILMKMAKAHDPEWILKIDCDEIFEDKAIENFDILLTQTKYDSFLFRKIGFHYRIGEEKCGISRDYRNGGIYLAKNSKDLSIANRKIHVGGFLFHRKLAISNFRIKHYWITSKNDAYQRYETYSNADPNRNYKLRDIADESNFVPVEMTEKCSCKPLCMYGLDCFYAEDGDICIIKPKHNKIYFQRLFKKFIIKLILIFKIKSYFLREKSIMKK